jgi:mono/diheme cytochrome c family protein
MKHWRVWVILAIISYMSLDLFVRRPFALQKATVVINETPVPPVPTLNPDVVAQGKTLYQQHCAVCHGVALEGAPNWRAPLADGSYPPPPHDRSGHTWHHADQLLLRITADGGNPNAKSKMPAFKDRLSEAQMIAILTYIKREWGREEREFQWWMTATNDTRQPEP